MSSGQAPEPTGDTEGSNELFYLDEEGLRQDSNLHEELLGEAEVELSDEALQEALASGMDEELAKSLFG